MAYQRQALPWGERDYDISPNPVYGQIKKGTPPPQYRFQGPRIGLKPNYTGANKPLIDNRAPAGTFTNMINQGAQLYVEKKQKDKADALRKGMKLARANNKVAALQQQKAQTAATNARVGQNLLNQWQQAANPTGWNAVWQQAQQWQANPFNHPPKGAPVTSLPPSPTPTPMSVTGVPALPPQRPARQARPLNPNAPQMPANMPPPMTPTSSVTGTPQPSTPPPPPAKPTGAFNWGLPPVDEQGTATTNVLDFSRPYMPAPKQDMSLGMEPDQEEKNILANLTGPRPPAGAPVSNSRTQNRPPK